MESLYEVGGNMQTEVPREQVRPGASECLDLGESFSLVTQLAVRDSIL